MTNDHTPFAMLGRMRKLAGYQPLPAYQYQPGPAGQPGGIKGSIDSAWDATGVGNLGNNTARMVGGAGNMLGGGAGMVATPLAAPLRGLGGAWSGAMQGSKYGLGGAVDGAWGGLKAGFTDAGHRFIHSAQMADEGGSEFMRGGLGMAPRQKEKNIPIAHAHAGLRNGLKAPQTLPRKVSPPQPGRITDSMRNADPNFFTFNPR
jgi:hypothetical protein